MAKQKKKSQKLVSIFTTGLLTKILFFCIVILIAAVLFQNFHKQPAHQGREKLQQCTDAQEKYCVQKGFTGGCIGHRASNNNTICKYGPKQTTCVQEDKDGCAGAGNGCEIIDGRSYCIYSKDQTKCTQRDENLCHTAGFVGCEVGPNQIRQCIYAGSTCIDDDIKRCKNIGFSGCGVQNGKRVCIDGKPNSCNPSSQRICTLIHKPTCNYDNVGNTLCSTAIRPTPSL